MNVLERRNSNRCSRRSRRNSLAPLCVGALVLAAKVPYLWRAWVSSPLDRANIELYGLLALAALALGVVALRRVDAQKPVRCGVDGWLAGLFAFGVLAMFAVGIVRDVNAIQLIAGVLFLWSMAWMAFGRLAAVAFSPAALLAILAVPGVIYWMTNAARSSLVAKPFEPFAPIFTADSQSGMLGRELHPSPRFTRFFRTSSAHQFIYADPSNTVAVLAVTVGEDIHEIHPATHCLRSAGWKVEAERLVRMARQGGTLEVDEALVQSVDGRMLVWIWYSSDDASTGSFILFRRMHSGESLWRTYQVSTALADGLDAVDEARERLRRFLGLEVAND